MVKDYKYEVSRLNQPIKIDAHWVKPQWQNIQEIELRNHMGEMPKFRPTAKVKMMYDDENLFIIFHVQDKYVRCLINEIDGPVYKDACVEFFFAPDNNWPERYFNLEINCGGTPLFHYVIVPRKEKTIIEVDDIKKIEIAHSLPQIVDPEITEPVKWTIECRIPLHILEKYSEISYPKPGVTWKANFYKIAEAGSNIHFLTWTFVDNPKPDFHLPKFFGVIEFE